MAPLTAPVVALLMLAGVKASDTADSSRLQGFLSKADAAEALYDYYKFITPNVAPVAQHTRAAQQTAGWDCLPLVSDWFRLQRCLDSAGEGCSQPLICLPHWYPNMSQKHKDPLCDAIPSMVVSPCLLPRCSLARKVISGSTH